jgi:hypothetical protein
MAVLPPGDRPPFPEPLFWGMAAVVVGTEVTEEAGAVSDGVLIEVITTVSGGTETVPLGDCVMTEVKTWVEGSAADAVTTEEVTTSLVVWSGVLVVGAVVWMVVWDVVPLEVTVDDGV